jgi:hypothetical protein
MPALLHNRIPEIFTKYDGEILGEWIDHQFRFLHDAPRGWGGIPVRPRQRSVSL